MSITAPALLIGRNLAGKYEVETLLGTGATGSVYRARQLALDKRVAIKFLHAELAKQPSFVERFTIEALSASRLDHPNSLRVLDFGEDSGLLYLVMEYVEAEDLLALMEREWPFEPKRVVRIMGQALAALGVAHDLGIVHRDLKPENILVLRGEDDEGHATDIVKVCDFGIAKMAARSIQEAKSFSPQLTSVGLVVGTPDYMSPEQARGLEIDGRSDLYSMGVVLYHMLTGRTPFAGESALAVALQHVSEEPVPPSQYVQVDPALERICLRALAKLPGDRFETARDMRKAFRAVELGNTDRLQTTPTAGLPVVFSGSESSGSTAPTAMGARQGPSESSPIIVSFNTDRRRQFATGAGLALAAMAALTMLVRACSESRATSTSATAALAAQSAPVPPTAPDLHESALEPSITGPETAPPSHNAAVLAANQPARERPAAAFEHSAPDNVRHSNTEHSLSENKMASKSTPRSPLVETTSAAITTPVVNLALVPVATVAPAAAATQTEMGDVRAHESSFDANHASVGVAGVTTSSGISGAKVRAALAHVPLSSCYRQALQVKKSAAPLQASVHLTIDMTGRVTQASLSHDGDLPGLRSCIEGGLRGMQIRDVDTGDGSATISLVFAAE